MNHSLLNESALLRPCETYLSKGTTFSLQHLNVYPISYAVEIDMGSTC